MLLLPSSCRTSKVQTGVLWDTLLVLFLSVLAFLGVPPSPSLPYPSCAEDESSRFARGRGLGPWLDQGEPTLPLPLSRVRLAQQRLLSEAFSLVSGTSTGAAEDDRVLGRFSKHSQCPI
jgi:hypothetical protein